MKIAIIDDGVSKEIIPGISQYYKVINGEVVSNVENRTLNYSHGTICAKIALENISSIEVIAISIYEEFTEGNFQDLITALKWCEINNIDFINLSNGSTSYFNNVELNDICYKLWKKGALIFAAVSNLYYYTVPAHLPYTIGVSRKSIYKNIYKKIFYGDVILNSFLYWQNSKLYIGAFNSFACAKLCNKVVKNKESLPYLLSKNKLQIYDFSLLKKVYIIGIDALDKRCLVFPYSDRLELIKKDDEKITLIVAKNFNLKETFQIVEQLSNNIFQLVWCNDFIPYKIKKICNSNGIRYWIPTNFTKSLNRKQRKKYLNLNEFVIIYDSCDNNFLSLLQLKNMFKDNGYNVIVFSEIDYSYLYGAIFSTKQSAIEVITKAYNPDIVIIYTNSDSFNCLKWDLKISNSTDRACITTDDNNEIMVSKNACDIYRAILQITLR